ncbi:hypothetical protein [Flavobacterium sp. 5]|uniref:hypothetical protein n=1 Tax=Flavobacterium sp. 5 TaxID=2035199 RepID=UPI000C2C757A|nr:hypothetical protein [Flavobacterium sp. 5]PKB17665.1 hypothetical protein CLU82_2886 [Flavobacterium sp. 5]
MKFTFLKNIILIATIGYYFFSCSSDLDFDQVNDFNTQPVATTNLAYIKNDASDFVSNGTETPFFSYTSNVEFLNTSFVESDLVKTELYFRIKNTIKRAYIFNIILLDENDLPIHTITMNVPEYNGTEVVVEKTETFTTANVDILKSTTKMIFSVLMLPGTPISEDTLGRVELSSSITAYFDIK